METFTAQQLVAQNVRRVRQIRDRSQSQLARQLGCSKQTLSKIETGARGITVDDLMSFAFALDVAPAVLLIPWDDDATLSVEIDKRGAQLRTTEAFGWIVGEPPDQFTLFLMANPVDYYSTTPVAVQRKYGRDRLQHVRESMGWSVSDDGEVIEAPGISIHRRPTEDER